MNSHFNESLTKEEHGIETAHSNLYDPKTQIFSGSKISNEHYRFYFWKDREAWKRASQNTLNCLIGCSIGDFGMIIFLQSFYPETPLWLMMVLAMTMGLITSILFESSILKIKEHFEWKEAFNMAFSMSFISMLGMEITENLTDYFLTGGTVPLTDIWYWIALAISLVAGFIAPLPYNYYKFRKHGKNCH
jgi:hypothetical protein